MDYKETYLIRIGNQLVPVNEEVYIDYYKMYRHEKYLYEVEVDKGVIYYDSWDNGKMTGLNVIADTFTDVEELVMQKLMFENLYNCVDLLEPEERDIIIEIYYNNCSERDLSKKMGIAQKTINDRKFRVLKKLKNFFEKF